MKVTLSEITKTLLQETIDQSNETERLRKLYEAALSMNADLLARRLVREVRLRSIGDGNVLIQKIIAAGEYPN